MNRMCKASALSMLGWYLMVPPPGNMNGVVAPNGHAPISQWTVAASFDHAASCENEMSHHFKEARQQYNKVNHSDLAVEAKAQYLVHQAGDATCIATDDPRLRANSDATQPTAAGETSTY